MRCDALHCTALQTSGPIVVVKHETNNAEKNLLLVHALLVLPKLSWGSRGRGAARDRVCVVTAIVARRWPLLLLLVTGTAARCAVIRALVCRAAGRGTLSCVHVGRGRARVATC